VIHCLYQFAGENILLDGRTNRISVINVFDNLGAPGFPLGLPRISLAFILSRDADDPEVIPLSCRVSVDEQIIVQGPIQCNFQGSPTTRVFLNLTGFVIPQPGLLKFSLRNSDESELGAWSIRTYQFPVAAPQMEIPTSPSA
jgi:hypothetical protein